MVVIYFRLIEFLLVIKYNERKIKNVFTYFLIQDKSIVIMKVLRFEILNGSFRLKHF